MRVCDYIANQLSMIGIKRIYGLMGGGAASLNDGFIKHPDLEYICFHNEQGAGHAAVGEAKTTGFLAVANPTTGCGGTNCMTSLLGAWQDSVPVLFISGNVPHDHTTYKYNFYRDHEDKIRKYGIQENDILAMVEPITKGSFYIDDVDQVRGILQLAIEVAMTGRPGPVWIDIPSNIQGAEMPPNTHDIEPVWDVYPGNKKLSPNFMQNILATFDRPLILAGAGIRQSKTVGMFNQFIQKYNIPYVSTYGARDYTDYNNQFNIGAIGIKGSRAGNFAMQNCNHLLILGCSLNVSHIGYDAKKFAPGAHKVHIDIDNGELKKKFVHIDEKYQMHLVAFFEGLL